MYACKTKTTTNKSKMTKNDCDGIMGKSKQVAICAPSCSAVQFGVQDKPWTGVAGAFVEQKLKVSKTGHACITFRNYFFWVFNFKYLLGFLHFWLILPPVSIFFTFFLISLFILPFLFYDFCHFFGNLLC